MDALLAPWKALKIVLEMFPGIALFVWSGYSGWSRGRARLRELFEMREMLDNAKEEGFKEFGALFIPAMPWVGALAMGITLYFIPVEDGFIWIVNACSVPASIVAYIEGRRRVRSCSPRATWRDFDLPWSALMRCIAVWVASIALVLFVLAKLGVYVHKP